MHTSRSRPDGDSTPGHRPRRRSLRRAAAVVAGALALTTAVPTVSAADANSPTTSVFNQQTATAKILEWLVRVDNVGGHLDAFAAIADANGGNRAASTPGYDISVLYVVDQLKRAGYTPELFEFEYPSFEVLNPAELSLITPEAKDYVDPDDITTFTYSGAGDVTAPLVAIDIESGTSGCEAEDFPGDLAGAIAVIQRGTCPFFDKATNALNAGAGAVVIFNDAASPDREGPVQGTLGEFVDIPVIGPSNAVGLELVAAAEADGTARVATDTLNDTNTTYNVIAETSAGDPDNVVVLGSHLDSVAVGPGINDNGSGSATVLEIAIQAAKFGGLKNQLRLAFWGAEELGLLGSEAYVASLDETELDRIAMNLNFDMVGSPNYARFVYDGNGSDGGPAGPLGSGAIEQTFVNYFDSKGLASAPTEFSGRSDYGPFIEAGVPAGGLFTGAEGIKTAQEAELFGGDADVAYDSCYHEACDRRDNVNRQGLLEMSKAAAYVTGYFGSSTLVVNGVLKQLNAESSAPATVEFDRVADLWIR